MRWSLLLVLVAIPTLAFARPKLAVAPLDGDKDGSIGELVADSASEHGKTTHPDKVSHEVEKLDIETLDAKSVKKLRIKLEADVVIYGTVERMRGKRHLELTLSGRGKTKGKLELEFKDTKELKKELQKKLGKQIEIAAAGADDEDSDDVDDAAAKKRKQKEADDAEAETARKKKREDDERQAREESDRQEKTKKKTKRTADREEEATDEDDSGGRKKKKKRKHRDDDEEAASEDEEGGGRHHHAHPRHVLTQAALWADVGVAFARRTLTYDATGNQRPPPVGTAAGAGEIEGEVYPAAFESLKGPAAGIGIAGAYDRTVGLGIAVPTTTVVAPIKSGFYWIGARYRFVFGGSSIAVGASYWRRYYMADRSKLMMPTQLDMPDVDYKAIAPDVTARFAATPKVGVFAALQLPLMLSSGPIQSSTSYGPSTILAFDLRTGVQIGLGAHYALQITLGFDQIGIKFNAKQGSQAAIREVSAATDRSLGLAATLGVMY